MKKYIIEKKNGELSVEIDSSSLNNTQLLEAFQRCREGRCDCPTDEYDKLESMRVDQAAERISLSLKAKPGQSIAKAAVAVCLDHTLNISKENE